MIGFIVGSKYPKVRYFAMLHQYIVFCPSPSPLIVALANDAIEI
jgi:hypothetical protein